MTGKNIFALVAIGGTTANWIIYTHSVLHKKTRPHVFSWFIWAVIMLTGFAAQWAGHAGIGAWPTAYSGFFCAGMTALALFYGEKDITRSDWIIFLGALSAIPAWILTKDPLAATGIVSLVDAAAFYPTFRKSYIRPAEENVTSFMIGGTVALFTLFAVENYSLTTLLYPFSLVLTHYGLVAMIVLRRRAIIV